MKFLLVSAMFPPIRTGTSFYTSNLAQALSDLGHQVAVVTLSNVEATALESHPYEVHRLKSVHIPLRNFFKHFRLSSIFPSNFKRLALLVKDFNPDMVVLVNHYLDIAFPAIWASRAFHKPLVCSVGTPLHSPNRFKDYVLRFLDRLIVGRGVFPFCDKIIGWDTNILRYIHDVHGSRFKEREQVVIYGVNGNIDEFTSHEHDYQFQGQILGVGAVIEQRDFVSLVDAFSIIAHAFPKLSLKIIGHVYCDKAVQRSHQLGISHRVHFSGEQPHTVVLQELKKSDLFFSSLSGKYLGMGTATLESMLMGVPTICNVTEDHLSGPKLKHRTNIILTNGLEPNVIANEIEFLLNNEDLRRHVGQNGRIFVKENMNWTRVAQGYEAIAKQFATH